MAKREGEVIVEVGGNGGCSEETERASTAIGEESLTQLYQGSPEIRRRSKELTDPDTRTTEVLRCSSNASFRRNSWKPPISKTRSRLIDPPAGEEPFKKSGKLDNSGGQPGKDNDNVSVDEDEIEDIPGEYKQWKFSTIALAQWVSLVLIIAALVCSLWIPILKRKKLWDLPLWKWEMLVLALICGRLVSGWGIRVVVIFIERNFVLRKRVLYFVYGLRRAVQNCLWLGLVLIVWNSIFDKKVEEKTNSKILPNVTKILVCFLVGTLIWLLKTLLVKVLALHFHVNNFFDRIQEALFNQYTIETLSGPPLFIESHRKKEEDRANAEVEFQKAGAPMPTELKANLLPKNEKLSDSGLQNCPSTVGRSPRFSRQMSADKEDEKISIEHLNKLNQKNISAWNMRRMVNIIRHGSLTTLDERILNSGADDSSSEIQTECQAKEAARKIFLRVAKPGSRYIFLEDLLRFMSKDEALKAMHQFGAASENKGITKSSMKDWMVHAFRERRALALSLNDTKTAVDKLHNMLDVLVGITIVIISLLILGVRVLHFLVFISSQLLLAAFIFGNTCKNIFEAVIFLFVMHPFDVGDRCEVEGIQMVVEEMNILTTIFLRYDNTKIIYPNSVLATKPITNYYRSPDMGDSIEFCIHVSTPAEKIATMKERITRCIENRSNHWHPEPMLIMKDVEDLNKVRVLVGMTHKMNHQDIGERWARRALLLEEMVKIFRELDIEYRLLPLDVNIGKLPKFGSE
ncbi:hypothetical protein UlMin_034002 [Ulmus minor]